MGTKKSLFTRLAAAGLALAVALGGIAPAVALAEDAPASSVEVKGKTLKVSRKVAKLGQKVTVSVQITGKVKRAYAFITPTSAKIENHKSVRLKKKSGTTYTGTVKVTNDMCPVTWRVDGVTAYQTDGSSVVAFYGGKQGEYLKKVQLKITGTKGDKEAPVVKTSDVKVSKRTVKPGKKMTITIPVTDNMAKKPFVSVYIVRTYNDWNDGISMTTEKDYGIQLKKKGNVYTGTFKAPTTKGTYKIQSIYVSDTIGNQRFYVDKRFKKATVKDVKSTYVSKAEIKRQLKHYKFINLKAYDFKVK